MQFTRRSPTGSPRISWKCAQRVPTESGPGSSRDNHDPIGTDAIVDDLGILLDRASKGYGRRGLEAIPALLFSSTHFHTLTVHRHTMTMDRSMSLANAKAHLSPVPKSSAVSAATMSG
jgi:hypothetical protein